MIFGKSAMYVHVGILVIYVLSVLRNNVMPELYRNLSENSYRLVRDDTLRKARRRFRAANAKIVGRADLATPRSCPFSKGLYEWNSWDWGYCHHYPTRGDTLRYAGVFPSHL
ncbi:hypothetical protein P691DRAFT_203993 [Macrolepiota fuliginosa MF-IS2]|uniref:Uncharacterized protein n=1 Tax=Macrolepiota fuliginosa MF-IS2 TaxID=1400762 RepID=A0A9P5XNW6_9AGAR|nr:hypothetical protein P691DRAFT_203993 [Macrolepiota fuliginosa MF-IS2]